MTDSERIKRNITEIMQSLPPDVVLVAAAKTRSADEVNTAVTAGIDAIGYNYIQEAERMRPLVEGTLPWHMIGHLQRNKVKKAVELFDMIETIDSERLALEVNKQSVALDKVMPVLIEINSGKESNKSGVLPENAIGLIRRINHLSNLVIVGLMTMGPCNSYQNAIDEGANIIRIGTALFGERKKVE